MHVQGQTPLFVACAANSRAAALYLASKGADVEVVILSDSNVVAYWQLVCKHVTWCLHPTSLLAGGLL